MDALVWGPVTRNFLHLLTISYPDHPSKDDIENNKLFLNTLGKILPCLKCRNHYENNISKFDLDRELKSKNSYMKLTWKMHNIVNSLNKDTQRFQYVLEEYKNIIDNGYFNPIKIYKENRLLRRILMLISSILLCTILSRFIVFKKE